MELSLKTIIACAKASCGAQKGAFSGSSQRQQSDLGWDADAYGEAESSKAAVHVEGGFLRAVGRGRVVVCHHWQRVMSGDEWSDQACWADAVIDDLKLYLSAVSVAGKAEFDA